MNKSGLITRPLHKNYFVLINRLVIFLQIYSFLLYILILCFFNIKNYKYVNILLKSYKKINEKFLFINQILILM